MTQPNRQTCACGKPTSGAVWCSDCRRTTHHAVCNVAVFHDDLETVRTGQTRYGLPAKGSIGKSSPLGMDARFGPGGKLVRIQDDTRVAVVAWAKALMAERPAGDGPAHDSVRSVCAYLDEGLSTIAGLEWAAAFKTSMLTLEHRLRQVVDRPPETWYAGVCGAVLGTHSSDHCACSCHLGVDGDSHECDVAGGDCGRELDVVTCTKVLYAEPEKDFVRCRDCGTEWPVAERRDLLLREAEDYNATVRMLARIVTTLGAEGASTISEARLEGRINVWVTRGRLKPVGTRVVDGKVRATYRVGDVLERLARDIGADTAARQARRTLAEAAVATRPESPSERAS